MTSPGPRRTTQRRAFRAALAGHAVEWYEFGVYAVVAAYVSTAMFPTDVPALSLLLTWSAYSVAFLVRPIGGVILAHIGDRVGRRRALFLTVTVMTVATFLMGVIPGYEVLGIAAPLAFVALRLAQGFAAGAEMPSAMSYVAETHAPEARVRAASILAAGTFTASLTGSLLAALLALSLGPEAMGAWGWRVLFVLALPLGLVAIALRRRAPEDTTAAGHAASRPLIEAMRTQRGPMARFFMCALVYCVGLSVLFTAYAGELLLSGLTPADVAVTNAVGYGALVVVILCGGPVVRRVGVRTTIAIGAVWLGLVATPALLLGSTADPIRAVLGAVLLSMPVGLLATPVYLALAEMFPPQVRVTAGAIAFNLATAVASLVPVITMALRTAFDISTSLPVVVLVVATAAVCVLIRTPRTAMVAHA